VKRGGRQFLSDAGFTFNQNCCSCVGDTIDLRHQAARFGDLLPPNLLTPCVEAIIAAVESPEPPLHLLLGRPAYETVAAKFKEFGAEMEKWRAVSLGADFPETK